MAVRATRRRAPSSDAARRHELFALATPLFARLGYREVTLKELAEACHLSPASLYHYFPSKLDLALYPFTVEGQGCDQFEARARLEPDPLVTIRAWLEAAIAAMPMMELAKRLALEAERSDVTGAAWRSAVARWRRILGTLAQQAAPQLDGERVGEVAEALMSVISGGPGRVRPDPDTIRAQVVAVLRGYLVPAGLHPARFDAALGAPAAATIE
ncbi:MAG TPA: helix-turn-helix domain-containing protein [Candidatus Limnocylindria bacterium]